MIVQGQCAIFKQNLLSGLENFATGTTQVYRIALYTADAELNATTLEYTTLNEVVGTGYVAGGEILVPIVPASLNSTAYVSFDNAIWLASSFLCRGALIYNSTTNAAVAVLDFGSDKTASGTFTVTFPPSTATTAVIRIS
tara:strand:+ start:114 stop:533 length:420 start_codon:yes stop_codon:yes gene_type:complete